MDVKPIRTDQDHRRTLTEIERLWDAKPGTEDHDRLEVLATLVDVYEREHHPIPPPDPVEAIRFRMEQLDLTRKDLEPFIGSRARVSEILARRRGLSLSMIRQLHRHLGIPTDILVGVVVGDRKKPARARRVEPRVRKATKAG